MWKTIDRPGYMGTNREEIQRAWNAQYGTGNWRIAWQWSDQIIERLIALQLYEDGYYEFLKANRDKLEWLVSTASDIFDTAPTNVEAGLSYDIQETPNNHIHDVAIRRAVLRNGAFFKGNHLVHVRPNKEGERLGPHLIPFHLPHLIYQGQTKYKGQPRDFSKEPPWWLTMGIPNSVEEFYQQNKVLQVNAQMLESP